MEKKVLKFLFVFLSILFLIGCEGKGTLVIDKPKGAKVYINGKYVGEVPLKIQLREGKYDIVVATSEFDLDRKKGVQIYFDHTTKLSFNPTPKGILRVETNPEGALVLEGKNPIGVAPFEEKIDVGRHKIIIKKGEIGTSRVVNIEYGKVTELKVDLEHAIVHFNADPPDATLIIDGKNYGTFPKTVKLKEGLHKITVSKDIYTDTFNLKVKRGDELRVTYVLKPVQLPPVQAYGPIAFTPDRKYLVTMGKAGIYFWDLKKFKPQISLYDPEDVRNFDKFINFGISDTGKYVAGIKPIRKMAYALPDKNKKYDKILVWDMTTGMPTFSKLYPVISKAIAVNKGAKNIYLVTLGGDIEVIDRKTGNEIKNIEIGGGYGFARYADGKIYVGTEDGNLAVVDTNSNSVTTKIQLTDGKINDIEVSADKKYLIVASNDGRVLILNRDDLSTYKEFTYNIPALSANISPKNKKLAVGKPNKSVEVYDLATNQLLYKIENLKANPISVLFSDEEILITASSIKNPSVNIWKNGKLLKKWIQTIE